jgi:hypothetical protein
MNKTQKIRWIAVMLFCFAIATSLLWIVWEKKLKGPLLADRTKYWNMRRISDGIIGFNTRQGKLPANLDEVVKAGYLPEKSTIYFCPMKHNKLWGQELPYRECEYEFSFEPNVVYICIPKNVLQQERYENIYETWRCVEITEGTTFK